MFPDPPTGTGGQIEAFGLGWGGLVGGDTWLHPSPCPGVGELPEAPPRLLEPPRSLTRTRASPTRAPTQPQ
eukprot:4173886-Pyramimonas_sp.AAC.1